MLSPWLTLSGMLLALGVLGVAMTIALVARDILRPPRLTDGIAMHRLHRLSPGDLGLAFEECAFEVRDFAAHARGRSLRLVGWWIAAPRRSGSCVILLHGHGDAKVGAIAWAPLLHRLNQNVLVVDGRAHGESGGRYATAGFFEREDLRQVIDQVRVERAGETERVVLFGLDSGAATVAAVAGEREDVLAAVMDSPIVDRRKALAAHAVRAGLPAGWVLSAALWWAEVCSGADFAAVSLLRLLPGVRCPVLVVVGEADELMDAVEAANLREVIAARRAAQARGVADRVVSVAGAGHLMALQVDPGGYTAAIGAFLAAVEADGVSGDGSCRG